MPTWATVALAVAAALALHLLVSRTGQLFLRFGPELPRRERGLLMQGLVAWPWLVGSVLITALSWPLPTLLSLIYPPMSSMVLGAAYGGAMGQPYSATERAAPEPLLQTLHLGWALGVLAVLAIVYRLLAPGIAL